MIGGVKLAGFTPSHTVPNGRFRRPLRGSLLGSATGPLVRFRRDQASLVASGTKLGRFESGRKYAGHRAYERRLVHVSARREDQMSKSINQVGARVEHQVEGRGQDEHPP